MLDRNKRRTLKIISAASTALASGLALNSTALYAAPVTDSNKNNAVTGNTDHRLFGSFTMQIITGTNTPEDTVIFNNDSETDIVIRQFLPDLVTQNEQMLDLNSLLANGDIVLKPGYPFATKAAKWQPLSLGPNRSYLWCDTAVSKLHVKNTLNDTGIITLKASVNNGYALLTAEHQENLFT